MIESLSGDTFLIAAARVQTRRADTDGLDRDVRDADLSLRWSVVNGHACHCGALYTKRISEGCQPFLHRLDRITDARSAIQMSEHFVYIENQFFITS